LEQLRRLGSSSDGGTEISGLLTQLPAMLQDAESPSKAGEIGEKWLIDPIHFRI